MGNKITEIEPCGKMVVLLFHTIKDTNLFKMDKSGILMPNAKATDEKKRVYATIFKIGPDVDQTLINFKVGDRVFYNEYDFKAFGDEETTYGLTKADSIFAVYKEDD